MVLEHLRLSLELYSLHDRDNRLRKKEQITEKAEKELYLQINW